MQSLSGDLVTSDSQLGPWSTYPYGYSEFTMPGPDWFTSLVNDMDGSPLGYDAELQHKEPYPAHLMHRVSPDSPIEVAEADSTQHPSYPFTMHQYHHHGSHSGTPDFHQYHNQKQTPAAPKMATHGGPRYLPHGYYNPDSRNASPSTAVPPSNLYPSPPAQIIKHQDVTAYNRPYGLPYMNGDHVPQPTTFSDSPAPFGAHLPSDLYQPYTVVSRPTYERSLPSIQSVLPTAIESVLPAPEYDMMGSLPDPMVSHGVNQSMDNGQCAPIKQEYMASYHSPSPSSLADGNSVKMELMSDTSQSPPPVIAPPETPWHVASAGNPSPQLIPPPESVLPMESSKPPQQEGTGIRKQARINNHYGAQFVCPDCERTFARQCGLTQHMKWHHSGDKPFRCSTCGKCFATEQALAGHLDRHTAVDKPHQCKVCPKAFFHKNDLRRHVYQHTGGAPHNCKYCGKAFARKDHCHSHEFSHERRVDRQGKNRKSKDTLQLPVAAAASSDLQEMHQ